MSKLVSLSKDDNDLDWFATAAVFDWVADFIRARVDDPEISEKLRSQALSGYLFIGELPDRTREQIIRALRDELVPAMEAGPPVQPVFDGKVRDLARLAAARQ
jgi:hypothetical protein